jgi:Na+/H+-translocating membrane pyrophosphatase
MPARPKDKSAAVPNAGGLAGMGRVREQTRDPVSLVVAVGITALAAGGIAAVFSAPLMALWGR